MSDCELIVNTVDHVTNTTLVFVPFTGKQARHDSQAKNLSNKLPKKKFVLAHPLLSGSLTLSLDGTFLTFTDIFCPISLRSASTVFTSTGFPEASLTQKTFRACSPMVDTSALHTVKPFSLKILVTSESKPTLSFAQSSRLTPCSIHNLGNPYMLRYFLYHEIRHIEKDIK